MQLTRMKAVIGVAAVSCALAVGACGSGSDESTSADPPQPAAGSGGSSLPQGSEQVKLDPAEFTTKIDNPYWPMSPGSKWVYNEVEDGAKLKVEVTVTDRTKRIANGITARVVHDVVSENGQPLEVTDDWYAQDSAGNIWYLGEKTAEYKNGKVSSRAGSFEAGVDGAQPGVALPGDPQVGDSYRQEYYAGQAEDKASVLSLDATANVPFEKFDGVLRTEDINPLDKSVENKFYAKGVGPIRTTHIKGATGYEELVSYQH